MLHVQIPVGWVDWYKHDTVQGCARFRGQMLRSKEQLNKQLTLTHKSYILTRQSCFLSHVFLKRSIVKFSHIRAERLTRKDAIEWCPDRFTLNTPALLFFSLPLSLLSLMTMILEDNNSNILIDSVSTLLSWNKAISFFHFLPNICYLTNFLSCEFVLLIDNCAIS